APPHRRAAGPGPARPGAVRVGRAPRPRLDLRARRRVAHRADRAAGRVLRRPPRRGPGGRGHRDVFARRGPGVGVQVPGGAVRDTARPLPFPRAARAVFDLALEGMVWTRRSLMMAALLALPTASAFRSRPVLVPSLPPAVPAAA